MEKCFGIHWFYYQDSCYKVTFSWIKRVVVNIFEKLIWSWIIRTDTFQWNYEIKYLG